MTEPWTKTFPFTVDLPGLINLMGTALYSRADAAIRELVQNAHDGILRRRMTNLEFQGTIRFFQDAENGVLRIVDDGIGLSAEEAERYLGTLGVGITGLMRREARGADRNDSLGLIGQFGIGLLSSFLIAERIVVESLRVDSEEAIRWEADHSTMIRLSNSEKRVVGTTISLHLSPECRAFAESEELLEEAIKRYADFLGVPIFLNDRSHRVNLMQAAWFEPACDEEAILAALEAWFHETPLAVIPVRVEKPVAIQGALYVSPQRLPGFSDEARVATTVRRMIVSQRIQGLMPIWAPFVRGVLELPECRPTASREELVRDDVFDRVRGKLEELLFIYFEQLSKKRPGVWEALLAWHRYTLAGSALTNDRLRALLRRTYRFSTHRGKLTFDEILDLSPADSMFEGEAEYLIWYHGDRRQEGAMDSIFAEQKVPCVHATLIFEESILLMMAADAGRERGRRIDCRPAVPGSSGFSNTVLGARDAEPLDNRWEDFFEAVEARMFVADCDSTQPVFAFLNERHDLLKTLDGLKKNGTIPTTFQRMIDAHLDEDEPPRNEILLNRRHPLVRRALEQKPSMPLASVLRVLVFQAIQSAGAALGSEPRSLIGEDLDWIAESL